MMTVYFSKPEGKTVLRTVDMHFNYAYYPEWLDDPLVHEMVEDVDRSKVISAGIVIHRNGLPMACTGLSGGVKCLILALKANEDFVYNSTIWGDNCTKWLAKISFLADFEIQITHFLNFFVGTNRGEDPICAKLETGEVITTCKELMEHVEKHYREWTQQI